MNESENQENLNYFKSQLFQTFQSTEIVDNLKSKMRFDLINKLKPNDSEKKIEIPENSSIFQSNLIKSIIYNYLKENNFNYTYSIFISESKLSLENSLKNNEIFEYFEKNSKIFKNKNDFNSKTIIEQIISLLLHFKPKENINRFCQTDHKEDSLNKKFENIEVNFNERISKITQKSPENMEEIFKNYKKSVELRYKDLLKEELEKLKQYEIANMKFEESQKFNKKILEFQKEYEKNNLERIRKISEREENALKLCKAKIEDIERKNFENRQNILVEMDKIKSKEKELENNNKKQLKILEERENNIKEREKEINFQLEEYINAKKILEEKIKENLQERNKTSKIHKFEQESKLTIKRELENEKEYSKQSKESLKIFENETKYLRKENENFYKENKDLLKMKEEQFQQIIDLRNMVSSLRERNEFMMNEIQEKENTIRKNSENLKEKERSNIELKNSLEQKRNEMIEMYKNYQNDIEKYQNLLQEKQKELHINAQKHLKSIKFENNLDINQKQKKINKIAREIHSMNDLVFQEEKENQFILNKPLDNIFSEFQQFKNKAKEFSYSFQSNNKIDSPIKITNYQKNSLNLKANFIEKDEYQSNFSNETNFDINIEKNKHQPVYSNDNKISHPFIKEIKQENLEIFKSDEKFIEKEIKKNSNLIQTKNKLNYNNISDENTSFQSKKENSPQIKIISKEKTSEIKPELNPIEKKQILKPIDKDFPSLKIKEIVKSNEKTKNYSLSPEKNQFSNKKIKSENIISDPKSKIINIDKNYKATEKNKSNEELDFNDFGDLLDDLEFTNFKPKKEIKTDFNYKKIENINKFNENTIKIEKIPTKIKEKTQEHKNNDEIEEDIDYGFVEEEDLL